MESLEETPAKPAQRLAAMMIWVEEAPEEPGELLEHLLDSPSKILGGDPFRFGTDGDSRVALAETLCTTGCDCQHAPCDNGDALVAGCDPCVAAICASDPYCCDNNWDGICVAEVDDICGVICA